MLLAISALATVRANRHLLWSFWGAGAMLLIACAVTAIIASARGRRLKIEIVLRKQHYLQACAHTSILLYWGWYWREVYHAAPLIAGQLAFAFAFDALLSWSRRDTFTLGFGPFPIIFSTNLFLWFKPDWFYLQFLMVAVGFAAKELIRWNKDGRRTHVFNPSSFALMVFSVGLLITGRTNITWGPEIASTQLNPPHIYLWIFLASVPGQLLFGVASMTWAAVGTAYSVGGLYYAATGMHFFPERPIPIAVFLGMHLLFTDPSTAPRSELGRLIFGVLYGLSVVGLLLVLSDLNLPTFYDKLLPVPILNLLILSIDRLARSNALRRFDPAAIGRSLRPTSRRFAYVALWTATFVTMQVLTGTQATLVRADALLTQGHVDEAITRYRQYVESDGDDPEGHNNLGVALLQAGRTEEAVLSFRRATQLAADRPKTLDNLGLALMRAGHAGDALEPLLRAAALDQDNADARDHLGEALMQVGRTDEGLASLRRAVELSPDRFELHGDLGIALMDAGRLEEATESLHRATELAPDSAEMLNNLGVALLRAGKAGDAVAPLHRAVELDPNNPGPRENLAHALIQAGRLDEATVSFRHIVDLQPDNVAALNNLAVAQLQSRRFDEAVTTLRRALALDPANADTFATLGVALTESGHVEDGLAAFRHGAEVQPQSAAAHTRLAEALMNAGHLHDAITSLERAVELEPTNADTRYFLARALIDSDNPRAAAKQLEEALNLRPDWVEALASLASLKATEPRTRDVNKAIALASRAAELTARHDAHVLDVLGAAYASAGRLEEATRTAEAADALASRGSNAELAAQIRARLAGYRRAGGTH
jgi:Flp pilus assembly protein TadD